MVSNQESKGDPSMRTPITEAEARFALRSIERRRQQVLAEIDVSTWYWLVLAAGWVVLGVLADYGPVWATIGATFLLGMAHATFAPRVISGRRGSSQLSIERDLVSRHVPLLVIGFLVVMTAATIGLALLFDADGARHPAALAGGMVATVVLAGGPALMAWVHRRAERV
jgi:hypothetical protein